jgi:Ca2+-binding EF-hand superfamily protein
MRPDFNLFDAFRIFDVDSKGYVSKYELKDGLANIGVYANYDELDLYFKRYDKDCDGRLKFSEFCDSMVPLDPYYSAMVNRRSSNNLRPPVYPRDECFVYATRLDFKALWRTHMRVETSEERLRQSLNRKPLFDAYDAFKTCDINEDGIVTETEIRRLMESKGLYVTGQEVSVLMNKLDKDRDGRISYGEFMEEILPKSPSKAF